MANYYTDHPEIAFYLQDPLMRRITELKEKGFSESKDYDYAPVDHEDCIENYKRLLEIVGDVAANVIEPNSESVDLEGPHLEDGRMKYASKTLENLEATRKAGLWGITMPRRYGGLNCPAVVFSMASEIVSAADAGFPEDQIYAAGYSMPRAVQLAHALALVGQTVLLSPACASFDMYPDMAHRGRDFKQLVCALPGKVELPEDLVEKDGGHA